MVYQNTIAKIQTSRFATRARVHILLFEIRVRKYFLSIVASDDMTSCPRSYLASGRSSYVSVRLYVEIRIMFGSMILSQLTHRSHLGFPIFTYLHFCVTLMLERHKITTLKRNNNSTECG